MVWIVSQTQTAAPIIDGLVRNGMLDKLLPRVGVKPKAGRS
jgi:hypothetical protein